MNAVLAHVVARGVKELTLLHRVKCKVQRSPADSHYATSCEIATTQQRQFQVAEVKSANKYWFARVDYGSGRYLSN